MSAKMASCGCPVHRDGSPPTLPLGVSFADRVSIEPIPQALASQIYEAHHSYLASTPSVNITHHGVLLDEHLVGAITYRHPLIRKMGDLSGDEIVEVARVCVAVSMPNLASAALARSQTRFRTAYMRPNGIKRLVTFVREDYAGSMIAALKGLGWRKDGIREGKQATNREEKDIHARDKARWVCDIESNDVQQNELTQYVSKGESNQ